MNAAQKNARAALIPKSAVTQSQNAGKGDAKSFTVHIDGIPDGAVRQYKPTAEFPEPKPVCYLMKLADAKFREELRAEGVRVVRSESGWFCPPQVNIAEELTAKQVAELLKKGVRVTEGRPDDERYDETDDGEGDDGVAKAG
jgi:hypothetical protein